MRDERNVWKILIGKPEGKKQLEKLSGRCEVNLKIHL